MAEIITQTLHDALVYTFIGFLGVVLVLDTLVVCSKAVRFMASVIRAHSAHLHHEVKEWRRWTDSS
jgi:hypothetical protein